jgi:hypothetical protein
MLCAIRPASSARRTVFPVFAMVIPQSRYAMHASSRIVRRGLMWLTHGCLVVLRLRLSMDRRLDQKHSPIAP